MNDQQDQNESAVGQSSLTAGLGMASDKIDDRKHA